LHIYLANHFRYPRLAETLFFAAIAPWEVDGTNVMIRASAAGSPPIRWVPAESQIHR
jgi:hypothetical protein